MTAKLVLGWVLALALLVQIVAHGAIALGLAKEHGWGRAALALLVPPLAPVWAHRAGMRRRVYVWTAALAVYAVGVAVS